MRTFSAALFAMTLLSAPAMAFSVDMSFPNLTWPEEATAPITQACADPVQLGSPDCQPKE